MLETLEHVQWNLHPQPDWNSSDEVRRALRALASSSGETGNAAYSRLLYTLGNNHAGTYFPVVLPVIPFLGEILRDGGSTARARTLDVLVDLLASFEPEPGFEVVETSVGPRALRDLLKEEVAKLASTVERIATSGAAPEETRLALDLLSLIRESMP